MNKGSRPKSKLIKKYIKEEVVDRYGFRGQWDDETGSFIQDHKYSFEKLEPLLRVHFEEGGSDHTMVIAGVCGTTHGTVYHWSTPGSKGYRKEFHELLEEYRTKSAVETDKWHRESANGSRPKANATTLNRRAEKFLDMVPVVKTLTKLEDISEIDAQIERIKELQAQYGEGRAADVEQE